MGRRAEHTILQTEQMAQRAERQVLHVGDPVETIPRHQKSKGKKRIKIYSQKAYEKVLIIADYKRNEKYNEITS